MPAAMCWPAMPHREGAAGAGCAAASRDVGHRLSVLERQAHLAAPRQPGDDEAPAPSMHERLRWKRSLDDACGRREAR
jgi:hypothetical protein